MNSREQELERKIDELEAELLLLRINEGKEIRQGRERMLQMVLTFISPLLIAFVGYLGWQTNNKLDENKIDRDRIESKIDEAKEETKVVAAEARQAVEEAAATAERVKVGTAEIKSAVAELRETMPGP